MHAGGSVHAHPDTARRASAFQRDKQSQACMFRKLGGGWASPGIGIKWPQLTVHVGIIAVLVLFVLLCVFSSPTMNRWDIYHKMF